ncbi:hypothetical protein ABZ915_01570 [Streptomyces sp. NPDC046915]|uniref:hypothetical protein n=1 Tax=Streptomyces sp. NPDC046915 TaxID=3155257 RepID=UPI0033CA2A03
MPTCSCCTAGSGFVGHSEETAARVRAHAGDVGRDPGCCAAEYLDQPVAPYTVDIPLDDGRVLRLGEADW